MAEDLGWTEAQTAGVNTAGTALVAFGIGSIVDKIRCRKRIVFAVAGAAVASGLTAVAGWPSDRIGGLGVVLLVLVRLLAALGYAEQAINATYLNELVAQTHADPRKAKRRGFIYSMVQAGWPVGSVLDTVSMNLLFPIGGAGGDTSVRHAPRDGSDAERGQDRGGARTGSRSRRRPHRAVHAPGRNTIAVGWFLSGASFLGMVLAPQRSFATSSRSTAPDSSSSSVSLRPCCSSTAGASRRTPARRADPSSTPPGRSAP